ncbi:nitroreductase family protein [Methanoregula sp.]|uniref:nitroreductase family protein n=1 Tax=Methanoregula sp. TaxID=2052170 RepID=UPI002CF97EED|nr:nitroreductase family protein [Methanoregula sp.]HVP97375.1 nitroreductase family protein [Methanoregula sp.]
MDSSDFKKFVSARCSVREYAEAPLSEDEIAYIVSCAGTAPSAGNLEAWDTVVVTDSEARFALADAALGQEHVGAAPALFVVCANYVRSMSKYGERGILYAVQDATIACTYMMLAAHSHGLSTCWTGAFDEDAVREILDLPPHVRPIAILAAGYGHEPAQHTGRMEIAEHLHHEVW